MPNAFHAPKLKVKWAKRHISELERFIGEHVRRDVYGLTVKKSVQPGQDQIVVTASGELPTELPAFIGDVVHNLRSALDLMACALVGLNDQSTKSVYFPFAVDADDLEVSIKSRNIDRAGPDVVEIIRSLKPYTAGNAALRAIHDMDIEDKHKMLVPIVMLTRLPDMIVTSGGTPFAVMRDFNMGPVHDGLIVVEAPAPLNFKVQNASKVTLDVVFPLESEFPLHSVVPKLAEMVDGIVTNFEAHCRAIGKIT
jgi:hypothetical protein